MNERDTFRLFTHCAESSASAGDSKLGRLATVEVRTVQSSDLDDLFLFIDFIDGHLAIDLGGFHAERHTDFSTFRIETTIQCVSVIVVD